MKYLILAFMIHTCSIAEANQSLYDIPLKDIDGKDIDLKSFEGKYILFVNVASYCGFTSQYSDMQKLHEKYKDNLVVIALPCNQFLEQEPGSADDIKKFCADNFDISFIITEKIDVKGDNIHELYNWLTNKEANGKLTSSVRWNFQKYIINRNGELITYFYSSTNPLSKKITSLLN